MKKSKVITFIGGFYIFGGIISFLSLLFGGSPLNTVFALPDIPDYIVKFLLATVYKGNIIKNLIMDCQSYTKYRPNETMGGIFVSWRRKEELSTGA